MRAISKELRAASTEPVILSILSQGDSYGYEIVQKIKELSNGVIKWGDGSIYPVLKKLTNERKIQSYWKQMDNKRHRKYYTIHKSGKKLLR